MIFKKKKHIIHVVLVQGSLSLTSKTSLLIDEVANILDCKALTFEVLDLRTLNMDFCNGRPIEEYNDDTRGAFECMKRGDRYVFGMPVYSHSISGALKNVIDIAHPVMKGKRAGVVCHAQGVKGYLASLDLLKVLSMEAQTSVVQPVVHTDEQSFRKGELFDDQAKVLIHEMVESLLRF